jgi:predicted nuclease of predicted toxin-antitoxin system
MIRFLIDEDMPRSTWTALQHAGFECLDVRDLGLRGATDGLVYERAQEEGWILLTQDLGFASSLRFPPGTHKGIVVARFPDQMSTERMNQLLVLSLLSVQDDLPQNKEIPDLNAVHDAELDLRGPSVTSCPLLCRLPPLITYLLTLFLRPASL